MGEGGESACWLDRVCEECGRLRERPGPGPCEFCGYRGDGPGGPVEPAGPDGTADRGGEGAAPRAGREG